MNAITKPASPIRCLHCGRWLRTAKSIARGYGPKCSAKVAASAQTLELADWKPAQIQSALELIEDAAIVRLRRNIFKSVSSKGDAFYLTAPQACNCPAGLAGRMCYHRAAVEILIHA